MGRRADEQEIRTLADELYQRADWQWAQNNSDTVTHGWKPESGFIKYRWEGWRACSYINDVLTANPKQAARVLGGTELEKKLISGDGVNRPVDKIFQRVEMVVWIRHESAMGEALNLGRTRVQTHYTRCCLALLRFPIPLTATVCGILSCASFSFTSVSFSFKSVSFSFTCVNFSYFCGFSCFF
jgi:hypothetical protein